MVKNTKKIRKNKLKINKTFYKRKNNRKNNRKNDRKNNKKSKNNKIKHKKNYTRKIYKKGGDLNTVYNYTVNPALQASGYLGKTIGDTANYVGQNIGITSNNTPINTNTNIPNNKEFIDVKYECEKYKNDSNYEEFDLEDYLKDTKQRHNFTKLYNENIRKKYNILEEINNNSIVVTKKTTTNKNGKVIIYYEYDFDNLDKAEVQDVLNQMLNPKGIKEEDFCIEEDKETGEIDGISDFYIKKNITIKE